MKKEKIQLKGITWGHTRGFVPMVATAQRFEELHPEVEIVWKKRTLQEFADKSVTDLAKEYDLMVIDHPWTGHAAAKGMLAPFDDFLPADFLADQRVNSVGQSYASYNFEGKQWALPTDAATPVAASRPDLLQEMGLALPRTFDDLLALAKKGRVGFSLLPIDVLMSFYGFCCSLGEEPCQQDDKVISDAVGTQVLQLLKTLADELDPAFYEKNPFKVFEEMTQRDQIVYCPFAYGYSNYAREGYARKVLHFHDLVLLNNQPLVSTLGGAGLAVSSQGKHIDVAMDYARFVASPEIQETLYTENGGQPGHLRAWKSDKVNAYTADYFKNTLPAFERAYLRPRYDGHLHFQDHAGDVVVNYLKHGGSEKIVLDELNRMYRESLVGEKAHG
ncbi:ABC transporter substrate-binding protein [Sphingobacterium gobiense]|uniref:ABC transporter substrate-binding protein n=1 Tax=Sphingobacterium gobiense TaxID=1382456 RepID=A0A2S9JM23_9SPHI|nr:extracellular solute-binding protein [Sphingobacterium gobiense]PRD54190.1 ABC transporter substrate-binding protein [Sphingobacterium gobiense]